MPAKEELAVRLDFEDNGAGKLTKNQTRTNNAVIRGKLGCDIIPCLNHGRCTFYPIGNLGFMCICPPGFYGDFCQYRVIEIECSDNYQENNIPEVENDPCPAEDNRKLSTHSQSSWPATEEVRKFSTHSQSSQPATEEVNRKFSTHSQSSHPATEEVIRKLSTNSQSSHPATEEVNRKFSTHSQSSNPATEEVNRKFSTHSQSSQPATGEVKRKFSTHSQSSYPEEVSRKFSSHGRNSCAEAFQRCLEENQQAKAVETDGRKSSFPVTNRSPCPGADQNPIVDKQEEKAAKECRRLANIICKRLLAVDRRNSFMENKCTETAMGRKESSRTNNQEPSPVNGRTNKNEQTKAAERSKRSTPSTRSQGPWPVAIQCCIEKDEQTKAAEKDRKKCATKVKYLCPYPAVSTISGEPGSDTGKYTRTLDSYSVCILAHTLDL
ncbi:uncharacterized protein LOC144598216 [Rhinoraja longicauda]